MKFSVINFIYVLFIGGTVLELVQNFNLNSFLSFFTDIIIYNYYFFFSVLFRDFLIRIRIAPVFQYTLAKYRFSQELDFYILEIVFYCKYIVYVQRISIEYLDFYTK